MVANFGESFGIVSKGSVLLSGLDYKRVILTHLMFGGSELHRMSSNLLFQTLKVLSRSSCSFAYEVCDRLQNLKLNWFAHEC